MPQKDDRTPEELDAIEQALQLPSFGRRRRGRKAAAAEPVAPVAPVEPVEPVVEKPAEAEAEPDPEPDPEPESVVEEPVLEEPVVPAPVPEATVEAEPAVAPAPVGPRPSTTASPAAERAAQAKAALAGVRERAGSVGGTLSDRLAARRRSSRPVDPAPVDLPEPEEAPTATLPVVAPAPAPEPPPSPEPEPEPEPEPAVVEPAAPTLSPEAEPTPEPAAEDAAEAPDVPGDEPAEKRPSRVAALLGRLRDVDLPTLPETAAVVVAGVAAGVVMVLLGGLSLRLCSVVQGSGSCGASVIPLLGAALFVAGLVSTRLLRAWEVADPGSTTFLGIGLVAMVVLLFLTGSLFSWAMAVVVPLLSTAMFLLSHFLTTKLSEGAEDVHPPGR